MNPGLYDENCKLLASWSELVSNYKLRVSNNYNTSYSTDSRCLSVIMRNNHELTTGRILVIHESVKRIGDHAFHYCNLSSIILPDDLIEI